MFTLLTTELSSLPLNTTMNQTETNGGLTTGDTEVIYRSLQKSFSGKKKKNWQ